MNEQLNDIKMIREMMEKSSKFISLSGLSGVIAGVSAILGAAFAYFYLLKDPAATHYTRMQELLILLTDALIVLTISITFALLLSRKKAKKNNQPLFNKITLKIFYNLSIPLLTGGIFSLIFLLRGEVNLVVSATLLFYGLALINASKYTYNEIHHLGVVEIVLGLLAALLPHNGIIFWTIGFGICHILYGSIMYFKYDRVKQ